MVELLSTSRTYRGQFRQCLGALESLYFEKDTSLNVDIAEAESTMDLYKVCLAMWHLLEIVLLHARADVSLLMAEWVHEHYVADFQSRVETVHALLLRPHPSDADEYWPMMYFLMLTGQRDKVIQLLQCHRHRYLPEQAETFVKLEQIVQDMPCLAQQGMPAVERIRQWEAWYDACQRLLWDDVYVQSDEQLKTMVLLLTGDDTVLRRYTTQWYELMAAKLLLGKPGSYQQGWEALMGQCIKAYDRELSRFDCAIYAILELDVASALRELSGYGFKWATSHLADLLTLCGHLRSDVVPALECNLREYFVLEYAQELMGIRGFWQLTSVYLETCPVFGPLTHATFLDLVPPDSDITAQKLVGVCQRYGLKEQANVIRRIRGDRCRRDGCPGSSLLWLLEANESERVASMCKRLLDEYTESGNMDGLHAVVESLGMEQDILPTKEMKFLTLYRELLLVLEDLTVCINTAMGDNHVKQVEEFAVKLFVQIFSLPHVPVKFWPDLMRKILPLLQKTPPRFSSRQTYVIMNIVQQLQFSYLKEEYLKQITSSGFAQLNQALAENLSHAIVAECATSPPIVDNLYSENMKLQLPP